MRGRTSLLAVGIALVAFGALWAAEIPVAVSPGSATGAMIESRCPTFSWSEVEGAKSYALVVYRLGEESEETEPVLRQSFSGSVDSWTPSLGRCLERSGRYAWSVRAVGGKADSEWSPPSLFEVASGPSEAEFEAALTVVREYLVRQSDSAGVTKPVVAVQLPAGPAAGGESGYRPDPAALVPVDDSRVLPVGDLDCRAGRYEDNGDGTVTDCRSGLIWLKDASCSSLLNTDVNGKADWVGALQGAGALANGICGLQDGSQPGFWRLPKITEFMMMVASAREQGFSSPALTDARGTAAWTTDGDAFTGVSSGGYWSANAFSTSAAWLMPGTLR